MEEAGNSSARRTFHHLKCKRRSRSAVWSTNVAEQAKKISETLSPRRTGLRNIVPDNPLRTPDLTNQRTLSPDSITAQLFKRITAEGLREDIREFL